MKTIFWVKKWSFCVVIFFFILNATTESNIIFRGLAVSRIQRRLLICLHTSQFTRNALQYNGKGSFCYGHRNIFLGSSQEKRTVTALARRGETPPTRTALSGWRTPCWQGPFANPPASSSWWSIAFILCIFFRYNSSVCGLVWLAAATAATAAWKLHDLSI